MWSVLAVAFYLWTPARSPAFVLQMIVPMALLGAFVIGYLHHTVAWNIVRYPIGLLALLTLCVQVANNFIWYAPDASQAPWARIALLYWTEPATTLQTPVQCGSRATRILGRRRLAGAAMVPACAGSGCYGRRRNRDRWRCRGEPVPGARTHDL